MPHHLLENLYDYRSLCSVLLLQNEKDAFQVFQKQAECLAFAENEDVPYLRCTMLISLNRSIYDFLLFAWDISFSKCCYLNMALSHQCKNEAEFFDSAFQIIHNYSRCLSRRPLGSSSQLREICLYIREHLSEPLTAETVAEHSYLSKSQLSRLFRAHLNMSFSEYLCQERIAKARVLLACGRRSITQISELCGFSSSAYFSTAFRRQTGCSPRCFCQRYCQEPDSPRLASPYLAIHRSAPKVSHQKLQS